MEIALVIGGTFLLCWLVDKGFAKAFRSQPQHTSGRSVRLNKYYGVAGVILAVLGVAAVFAGLSDTWILSAGGGMLILLGIGLSVYYLSFGVFYDGDSFVFTTFGKKSTTYLYKDIAGQQLYNSYGNIVIELHMADGRTVQLHASMTGVYPFLDAAFDAWLRQTGKQKEECTFHDPDNSCWFPPVA